MFISADRHLADIAAAQDGIFRIEDARSAGLSDAQIHHRSMHTWNHIYEGICRAPGAPTTWPSQLRAAVWIAGEGAAISHRAAAALYELPGGRDDLIELTCPRWLRARRDDLIVHESRRLRPADIQLIAGIPVTRPERVLLDLAWLTPSPNYLEMVIHAARRRRLITFDSTNAMFLRHARRGLRGVKALRIALERWNPDSRATESEMETQLLQALRAHGLPEPVVQFEVYDGQGQFVARTDLGWPALRATLDYDSKQEHSDEFQISRDNRRRNAIIGAGYSPLVARLSDVRGGAREICERLLEIARSARPSTAAS
jgi:hypothetical protein